MPRSLIPSCHNLMERIDNMNETQDLADNATPMSSEQYAQTYGTLCPFCKSEGIRATGPIEIDGSTAWQSVECLNCSSYWTDNFVLVGYSNLNECDSEAEQ